MKMNRILAAGMIGLASLAFGAKAANATVYAFDNFQDESNPADQYGWANGLDGWAYAGTLSGGVYSSPGGSTTRDLATPIAAGGTIWYAETIATPTLPLTPGQYAEIVPGNDSGDPGQTYQPIELGFQAGSNAGGPGWPYTGIAVSASGGQFVTLLTSINTVTGAYSGWGVVGPASGLDPANLGTPLVTGNYGAFVGENVNMLYLTAGTEIDMSYAALADNASDALNAAAPVPEPATLSILGIGAIGLLRRRRRA